MREEQSELHCTVLSLQQTVESDEKQQFAIRSVRDLPDLVRALAHRDFPADLRVPGSEAAQARMAEFANRIEEAY